ncbi:uncharacterized protein LOC125328332 [Corvus hawaiiensis]|uniref:uncharacterized protein LOC125328332 n=1 Tax=Corvus hawaiiensis TaxID=134902 RepID=UPI002019805B|nr:uncharacterized protein LOC125328332 [Corvus hawaiiensis]XP_048164752.1 uncharacterized protein LOC125328332 [Corvus hawaiiensis]
MAPPPQQLPPAQTAREENVPLLLALHEPWMSVNRRNGNLRIPSNASQEIPLAGEGEGSHKSQPRGRAAAQLQGDSAAGGDGVQGAKLLFQHGRNGKAGNVLCSPSPAPRSHHFAVAACLFTSASRLWTPPETCHGLEMLSSTSAQELPPKPQPVAKLIALARVKGRLRCDDAVLQTGILSKHCFLRHPSHQGHHIQTDQMLGSSVRISL